MMMGGLYRYRGLVRFAGGSMGVRGWGCGTGEEPAYLRVRLGWGWGDRQRSASHPGRALGGEEGW